MSLTDKDIDKLYSASAERLSFEYDASYWDEFDSQLSSAEDAEEVSKEPLTDGEIDAMYAASAAGLAFDYKDGYWNEFNAALPNAAPADAPKPTLTDAEIDAMYTASAAGLAIDYKDAYWNEFNASLPNAAPADAPKPALTDAEIDAMYAASAAGLVFNYSTNYWTDFNESFTGDAVLSDAGIDGLYQESANDLSFQYQPSYWEEFKGRIRSRRRPDFLWFATAYSFVGVLGVMMFMNDSTVQGDSDALIAKAPIVNSQKIENRNSNTSKVNQSSNGEIVQNLQIGNDPENGSVSNNGQRANSGTSNNPASNNVAGQNSYSNNGSSNNPNGIVNPNGSGIAIVPGIDPNNSNGVTDPIDSRSNNGASNEPNGIAGNSNDPNGVTDPIDPRFNNGPSNDPNSIVVSPNDPNSVVEPNDTRFNNGVSNDPNGIVANSNDPNNVVEPNDPRSNSAAANDPASNSSAVHKQNEEKINLQAKALAITPVTVDRSLAPASPLNVGIRSIFVQGYVQGIGGISESLVIPSDEISNSFGIGVGVEVTNRNFTYTLGVNGLVENHNDLILNRKVKYYNFGSDFYNYKFDYKQLYTLEALIGVGYNLGRHRFDLGIRPSFVMSSRMSYEEVELASINEEPEVDNNESREDYYGFMDGVHRFGLKPTIGYSFKITSTLSLGANFGMELMPSIKEDFINGINNRLPFDGQIYLRKTFSFRR